MRKVEKTEQLQASLERLADNDEMDPKKLKNVLSRLLVLKVSGTNNLTTILRCVAEVAKLQGLYVEKKVVESKVTRGVAEHPEVGGASWAESLRKQAAEVRAQTSVE